MGGCALQAAREVVEVHDLGLQRAELLVAEELFKDLAVEAAEGEVL